MRWCIWYTATPISLLFADWGDPKLNRKRANNNKEVKYHEENG